MAAINKIFCHIVLLFIAAQSCVGFATESLDGKWTVHSETHKAIEAQVPGGIYSDLMRNGDLPDIFYGYADVESRWVGNQTWIYTKTFTLSDSTIFNHEHVNLILEGVDTFSTIYLNGKLIGSTDNMFVRYEIPIDGLLLQNEKNELTVIFDSPIQKAQELFDKQAESYVVPPKCSAQVQNGECHVNHIRKMQASFSWDWGPAVPSVGIWKSVYLNAYNQTYIKDITFQVVTSDDDTNYYEFTVAVFLARNSAHELDDCALQIELGNNQGSDVIIHHIHVFANQDDEIIIEKTFRSKKYKYELWWPNGYGNQTLYPLTVTLFSAQGKIGNRKITSKAINVGIREIELVQEPLANGLTFYFKINGLAIFAKGSNMVPSHILPEHSNNKTLVRQLMKSAKDVHMNMIRVWGGGLYESDYLYELADEMGIMIWQDFMFACAMYPVNSEFLRTVEEEVEHQIRRLQHHPSIVLWAGNNENEAALTDNWYGTVLNRTRYDADYRQLYGKTIRDVVIKNDPSRKYLSSSPTNGVKSEEDDYISSNPGDNKYGDVHYYDYIFDSWNINKYPIPRFASEYGYQALPSYNSMQSIADNASELFIDGKFMQHRQHHLLGNIQMELMIRYRLELPTRRNDESFNKAFFFYSQIIQAMGVKIQTEHYRQWQSYLDSNGNGMTMGALYWQLNCPWLAPTWSSIESTGKWLMLHYFAKDFFAPIIVTSHQHLNQDVDIYIVSDQPEPILNATLAIEIYNWDSFESILTKYQNLDIKMGSQRMETIDIKHILTQEEKCTDSSMCFVRLTVWQGITQLSPANHIFPVALKSAPIPFANVQIEKVQGISHKKMLITVTSDQPAAFVWLESTFPGTFSENGFMMVSPRIEVVFNSDIQIVLDDFIKGLTVTHLRDKQYFLS